MLFAYYELDGLLLLPHDSKLYLAWKAISGISVEKVKAYSNYSATHADFFDLIWAFLALITAQVNAMRVSRYKRAIYRFKQRLFGTAGD